MGSAEKETTGGIGFCSPALQVECTGSTWLATVRTNDPVQLGLCPERSSQVGIRRDSTWSAGEQNPIPPVVSFSADPITGGHPLTVRFTDLSSGSPSSWKWSLVMRRPTPRSESQSYLFRYRELHRHTDPPQMRMETALSRRPGLYHPSLPRPPSSPLVLRKLHLSLDRVLTSPITRSGSKSTTPPAPKQGRMSYWGPT